ncbi:falz-related bromodomain-containing protein [Anaeramoeba flamelloides]|uniref:Falz-related bromodomain-containing protein n=1 Tax=Anaeramoeba flamelloides TaxID=1746091 RepID=A0AAV7YFG2_9EUKA|nr:falz-related bromodomain-containing protein [Anaeramoeba flamelloides]
MSKRKKKTEIWMKLMYRLIEKIKLEDDAEPFLEPVDWEELNLQDYTEVIQNPMDLHTIQRKLRKKKYSNQEELVSDFELMIDNAKTYNYEPTHPVHMKALSLHTTFLKQYMQVEKKLLLYAKKRNEKNQNLKRRTNQPQKKEEEIIKKKNSTKLKKKKHTERKRENKNENENEGEGETESESENENEKQQNQESRNLNGQELSAQLSELKSQYQNTKDHYKKRITHLEEKIEKYLKKADNINIGSKILTFENDRISRNPDLGLKAMSSNLLGLVSAFVGGPLQLDNTRKRKYRFADQSLTKKLTLQNNFPFGLSPYYAKSPYSIAPLTSMQIPFQISQRNSNLTQPISFPKIENKFNIISKNMNQLQNNKNNNEYFDESDNEYDNDNDMDNNNNNNNNSNNFGPNEKGVGTGNENKRDYPKRSFSYEEKYKISQNIESLDDKGKYKLFQIIRNKFPSFSNNYSQRVAKMGFDELDNETLHLIKDKTNKWKRKMEKNEKSGAFDD